MKKKRTPVKTQQDEVEWKGNLFRFTRQYKRVKNLNLRVRKDGSIVVSANSFVSEERVRLFVLSHADFLLAAIARANERAREEDFFRDGDKIYFFGKEYTLRVLLGAKEKVFFEGENLVVISKAAENERVKKLILAFRKIEGMKAFLPLVEKYYPFFSVYTSFPKISLRDAKTRWGSCTPKKQKIMLSIRLTEKDIRGAEYVVVHELAHYVEANHSPAFYKVVEKILPNWKEYKKYLQE